MARDDYETRRERQRQGVRLAKIAGKYAGRSPNTTAHHASSHCVPPARRSSKPQCSVGAASARSSAFGPCIWLPLARRRMSHFGVLTAFTFLDATRAANKSSRIPYYEEKVAEGNGCIYNGYMDVYSTLTGRALSGIAIKPPAMPRGTALVSSRPARSSGSASPLRRCEPRGRSTTGMYRAHNRLSTAVRCPCDSRSDVLRLISARLAEPAERDAMRMTERIKRNMQTDNP